MVDATTGAVTDQTDEPLHDLEDAPGPPGRRGVSRTRTPEDTPPMPGAPREPDDHMHDPDPYGPDDLDRRDVPMLGGAGPILAILALTLLALLSVQLTGTR